MVRSGNDKPLAAAALGVVVGATLAAARPSAKLRWLGMSGTWEWAMHIAVIVPGAPDRLKIACEKSGHLQ